MLGTQVLKTSRQLAWLLTATTLVATPALADVEKGVNDWTNGNYPAAVKEWGPLAQAGDADAQFNMGQAYKLGRGVTQDLSKAEELFGSAAGKGHLQAADNLGLLLFQRGERVRAMPYIQAASGRGDPRAQYLLGVSLFNGDGIAKDWVRAYALTSLAQQAGLNQATNALRQMDQYIPLEQRQRAATLATQIAANSDATRARQFAAADLQSQPTAAPRRAAPAAAPTPSASRGSDAQNAGADFARPQASPRASTPVPPRATPVPTRTAPPPRATARPPEPATVSRVPAVAPSVGGWRVQLGAFSVAANANALWARVSSRPELQGKGKMLVPAGKVTKLQAGGFASQSDAQAACNRLSAAGFTCLATRN